MSTKVTMAQAAGDVRAVTGGNAQDFNHVPPRWLQGTARQYATVLEESPGTTSTGNATLTACKPSGYREHPVGSLATVHRGTVENADEPGETAALGETFPTLPHLHLSGEALEARHPRILAPPEEPLQDLAQDETDQIYKYGMGLARELQETTDEHGRRRHAYDNDTTTRTTPTTTAPTTTAATKKKKKKTAASAAATTAAAARTTSWTAPIGPPPNNDDRKGLRVRVRPGRPLAGGVPRGALAQGS